MSPSPISDRIAKARPGDGSLAGSRKPYLARGLQMTLIERLRAVEQMAETAELLRHASANSRNGTSRS